MQILDNVNKTVKDDLAVTIEKGSKLRIAAACFSIYAYQVLKKQLDGIEELRFIFTSPAFVTEKAPKEKREFYIPRLDRERSLYGTEFEVKLRNELTQKAIARECSDWIRKKVRFMSNITNENMGGFMNVINPNDEITYMPLNGFASNDRQVKLRHRIKQLEKQAKSEQQPRRKWELSEEARKLKESL